MTGGAATPAAAAAVAAATPSGPKNSKRASHDVSVESDPPPAGPPCIPGSIAPHCDTAHGVTTGIPPPKWVSSCASLPACGITPAVDGIINELPTTEDPATPMREAAPSAVAMVGIGADWVGAPSGGPVEDMSGPPATMVPAPVAAKPPAGAMPSMPSSP
mmetsp:Transcript_114200/g.323416  ORF Transcript_114200/g.323416 Transcript_114200/m.323416 type:complete len:160 (-) Transcript_114200:855-1334(-)